MRRTILLADDSLTIQRLITQTFADADFDVVSVSNGDAAIKKFEEVRPSIVLADIYMPGKNGYEVCAYIKAHSERGATPVVLLAGAFDVFNEDTAKEAGAAACVTKPFEPQALVELVMSMIPAAAAPLHAAEPAPAVSDASEPLTTTATSAPAAPQAPPNVHAGPAHSVEGSAEPSDHDLLGLESIFEEPAPKHVPDSGTGALSEDEIERIADRVIQRLSVQAIESIAWDIVPDIAERVVRDELKKSR